MTTIENQIETLETALNRKAGKYVVKLSNVGNPDYRQDSNRPLPDTTCGFARVDTLAECSDLCLLYIAFYDLGGGNWNGGQVFDQSGVQVGKVAYNGRIHAGAQWKLGVKWIYEPSEEVLCAS